MALVTVAYWHNSRGEELSSRVRARFHSDAGEPYVVVYHGQLREFVCIADEDCIAIRRETVR